MRADAVAVAVAPASAAQRLAMVSENVAIARDTYRIRLEDADLARAILPGQFVMIRPGAEGAEDPLLGRPFALYDVVADGSGEPCAVDIVYLVLGRGTSALARRGPGERVSVWGPLGNGFGPPPVGPVVFVAGGIGQTPFLALGRWWLGKRTYGRAAGDAVALPAHAASSATLLYGVRTAAYLAGLDDFRRAGIEVEVATDDGSAAASASKGPSSRPDPSTGPAIRTHELFAGQRPSGLNAMLIAMSV
jgi:dihydroorotate dehydrogenase electron transfer subunit